MRFPSISALVAQSRAVLIRFPWVLASGAVAAAAAIIMVDHDGPSQSSWGRIMMVAALGLPLFTALTLLAEQWAWSGVRKTGLLAAGALLLMAFYQVWPGPEVDYQVIRYFQLSATIHLLVAFLPFLGAFRRETFWQYNRRLFESFLRAGVFSAVLFLGLVIALAALDQLFGVDVPEESYFRLWVVMAFVVNTWIFLGSVPGDLPALARDDDYPRALKVLSQYILTPLVTIYLVMLTAYLVKILITGDWPSGWIGYLVASVAVSGLLGFLLVAPLRDREGEGWIRTYSRWLFIGLIPSAVMFLLALWKRIEPYGLTELRVLGFLLGIWLLAIAIFYSVRRNAGIHVIPISLAGLLLLTLYGPVSATNLSVASQARRLRALVAELSTAATPSTSAQIEVSAALRYLLHHNAGAAIRSALGDTAGLASLPPITNVNQDSAARAILDSLDLDYTPSYGRGPAGYFILSPDREMWPLDIRGYDYTFPIDGDSTAVAIGGDSLLVVMDSTTATLRLSRRGEVLLEFDLRQLIDTLVPDLRNQVPANLMRLTREGHGVRALLRLTWLNGRQTDSGVHIGDASGDLYLQYEAGVPLSAPGTP